jgi:hypothetical protein
MTPCSLVDIYGRTLKMVENHFFFTSALAGGEWSASLPYRFTSEERAPDTNSIGGWVPSRADAEKIKFLTLPGLELRPPRSSSP